MLKKKIKFKRKRKKQILLPLERPTKIPKPREREREREREDERLQSNVKEIRKFRDQYVCMFRRKAGRLVWCTFLKKLAKRKEMLRLKNLYFQLKLPLLKLKIMISNH